MTVKDLKDALKDVDDDVVVTILERGGFLIKASDAFEEDGEFVISH